MSTSNIVGMNPENFSVTFALRGRGTRTYWYSPADFASIAAGADPSNYEGDREPPAASSAAGIASDILEAGEIAAGL